MTIRERASAALKLAAAAWPRPWWVGVVEKWHIRARHPDGIGGPVAGERVLLRFNEHFPYAADATFIASARDDVPDFAQALLRLTGQELRDRLSVLLTRAMTPHLSHLLTEEQGGVLLHDLLNAAMRAVGEVAEGSCPR